MSTSVHPCSKTLHNHWMEFGETFTDSLSHDASVHLLFFHLNDFWGPDAKHCMICNSSKTWIEFNETFTHSLSHCTPLDTFYFTFPSEYLWMFPVWFLGRELGVSLCELCLQFFYFFFHYITYRSLFRSERIPTVLSVESRAQTNPALRGGRFFYIYKCIVLTLFGELNNLCLTLV